MTTATGEYALNFAVLSNQNPFSDSNFTNLASTMRIASGLLRNNGASLIAYTGAAYDGGPVRAAAEINASPDNDEVLVGALDENGDGFLMRVRSTAVIIFVYDNNAVVDSFGTGSTTFSTDDVYALQVTKGSPNTVAATRNGVTITLSGTTYSKTLSNLRAVWGMLDGNVSGGAIKSLAVQDGLSSASTVSPTTAQITLQGKTPTTSAFANVRIRDVLVNESGQAVGSAANITLLVWYGGVARGAPDVSLNGQTTDANGTASWSIATGTLSFNDKIFYLAQDSVSFSNYTCARMTPSYE